MKNIRNVVVIYSNMKNIRNVVVIYSNGKTSGTLLSFILI